jgi:hypothetical protein
MESTKSIRSLSGVQQESTWSPDEYQDSLPGSIGECNLQENRSGGQSGCVI